MKKIRQELKAMSEKNYHDFSASLSPGFTYPMLGVRIPILRQIAKKMVKENTWKYFCDEDPSDDYFEEILLRGFVIGYACLEWKEAKSRMGNYAGLVNNWALCDCACSSFKIVRHYPEDAWIWLRDYLYSQEEFPSRFGIIMLLSHFINDAWIDRVLNIFTELSPTAYYSRMALAWALSVCFVKYPEKVMPLLKNPVWDRETYRKTLQKILESNRLHDEYRFMIRDLRDNI